MSCCQSCTFCLKCERAVTKERRKSLIKSENRNKFCEKCFFCRSLHLCPQCSKCPQCCKCQAGLLSFWQKWSLLGANPRVVYILPLPLPEGGFTCTDREKGRGEGKGSDLSSLFQQIVYCPQTKPEMAANLGPQCSKSIFERKNIQNGDPRNYSISPYNKGNG